MDLEPKIADFGFSRVVNEEEDSGKTSTLTGPIRWMCPESLKNQTYSEKTDIWMFGCTLYEIIARQVPHAGRDLMEVGVAIRSSLPSLSLLLW